MNLPLAIVGSACGASALYLTVRFINRPDERPALLLRLAVFLCLAALPLFVRVFVKREVLMGLVSEFVLRAILIHIELGLAALHLATSLVAARIRKRRQSALWEIGLLLPFAALAIFIGYGATVTAPERPPPRAVLRLASPADSGKRLAVESVHNTT